MGFGTSKLEFSHGLRKSLRDIPFREPNQVDYEFLANQTNLSKNRIKEIFDEFLRNQEDGRITRKDFAFLYSHLKPEAPEMVQQYVESVFNALGVTPDENDFITLNEFLITFALLGKSDSKTKLEYAFNIYDINRMKYLSPNEVKNIIYGILELFNPKLEDQSITDVVKAAMELIKVSTVVTKEDFINGLMENKDLISILNPQEKC